MKFKIVTIFIALILFIAQPVNISKADLASDLLKKAQELAEKQKIKGKKLEAFILSNIITVDYEGKEQTYKFNKDITYNVYENSKVIGDGTWAIKGLTKSSIKLSGYRDIYFQIYSSKDRISTLINLKRKSDGQTNRKILKISSLNNFEEQLAKSKIKKEKKKLVKKEEEKLTEEKAAEAKKLTEKKVAEAKKLLLLSPEKKLEIAQQFLENVKTFVKLYPDEFDTIKIFEFILATRPIIEGTLDDKLKEDLKLFIEFTNKSKQFVKYQDEIEKNIKNGLSHKKAVVAVKKEEKKEVIKKEERKEEKINKSNIKNKNDLSKYLIENGLVYINNDGSTAKFIFFQNGKGTHQNRIKKIGITWKVENKNIFRWQDTEFLKRGIGFASVTLDFDSDLINMVLSDGAKYMFKIK